MEALERVNLPDGITAIRPWSFSLPASLKKDEVVAVGIVDEE